MKKIYTQCVFNMAHGLLKQVVHFAGNSRPQEIPMGTQVETMGQLRDAPKLNRVNRDF